MPENYQILQNQGIYGVGCDIFPLKFLRNGLCVPKVHMFEKKISKKIGDATAHFHTISCYATI